MSWQAIVVAIVAAVTFLLPLPPSQAAGLDVAAAWVGVTGVVAAVLLWTRPTGTLPSRALIAWGALLAWGLVSTAASGRVWASLVGESTSMLGWFALVSLTAVALASRRFGMPVRSLLERYAWAVVLLEALLAIFQRVAYGPVHVAAGTLSNSTNLGVVFLLLLPYTMPSREAWSDRWRYFRLAAALLGVIALVATASRVAGAIAVVWLAWVLLVRAPLGARARRQVVASLALLLVAVAILASGGELGDFGSSLLGERPQIYRQAVRAVAARPVLGWGPDGFLAGGSATSTPEQAAVETVPVFGPGSTDPHNAVLWLAVSTGMVGLALALWFVIEAILRWRRARGEPGSASALWALAGTVLVAMTAPLTLHVLPLLAVVVGLAPLGPAEARDRESRGGVGPLVARGLTVAAIAIGVVLAANASTRANLEVASAERSARLAPVSMRAAGLWRADAHLAYLSSMHIGWAAATDPAYAGDRLDLAAIERACDLDRRNPQYALERARTLRYYREPLATVSDAFAETFRRYPLYPLAHAEFAAYLAENGLVIEAREQLGIATLVTDRDPARLSAVAAAQAAIAAAGQ